MVLFALVAPAVSAAGTLDHAADFTTDTRTRSPSDDRIRIRRSVDTCARSPFRIAVTLVRDVPARSAIWAWVYFWVRATPLCQLDFLRRCPLCLFCEGVEHQHTVRRGGEIEYSEDSVFIFHSEF